MAAVPAMRTVRAARGARPGGGGAAGARRAARGPARDGVGGMRAQGRSAAGGVACSAAAAAGASLTSEEMARFADIIRKPILTETTTKAIEDNKYYFEVRRAAPLERAWGPADGTARAGTGAPARFSSGARA